MNPILPGFHPDPSICRVGEDYYLVNSTFEWYPGLPVYHSRDLVNWKLISHGIDRPGQVDFPDGLDNSMGVFAPTIRYHEGTFYIINTCVQCGHNFYLTATDPAGPWSDPVWLDAPGIDPSLFWDEDGKCYYVGNGNLKKEQEWPQQQGVWMQELDLEKGQLTGPRKQLTHGHANNAVWAEGPHLYKINGRYILLVAEGGTDFHHSITVHQSDRLWGPYISNYVNPVFTHRHLGLDYPIHSVGHADLVETQNGEWWSVMLAKRFVDGYTLLARETFLTPVRMEEQGEWLTPVYNPGIGRIQTEQKRPDLPWSPVEPVPSREDFEGSELALHWNFLRTPLERWYRLEEGHLKMDLRPQVADSLVNPSLIARRIRDHKFDASVKMSFSSRKENEQAGMILYRNSENHFQLVKSRKDLVLIKTMRGVSTIEARVPCPEEELVLHAEAEGLDLQFHFSIGDGGKQPIGGLQSMMLMSDEVAQRFNGPYVGMYASSNGEMSKAVVSFDWFEYIGKDR